MDFCCYHLPVNHRHVLVVAVLHAYNTYISSTWSDNVKRYCDQSVNNKNHTELTSPNSYLVCLLIKYEAHTQNTFHIERKNIVWPL